MKTTSRTFLRVAAVVLSAVSCQKSIEPAVPAEDINTTIEVSINGLMGEYAQADATKSELVNTLRVSWQGGETVYVYDGTQCLGSLTASLEGDEDRYALLSTDGADHKITAPAAGTTKLTLVHSPLLTSAPSVSDGAISISLAAQNGQKAPFVAYATLDYNGEKSITGAVVPFKFATSVIKVNCIGLQAGIPITSATLRRVNTACKISLSGTAAPGIAGDTDGTITRKGDAYFATDKVNSEGVAVFQVAVPVLYAASGTRILSVKQGLADYEYKKFSTKALPAATAVNTVCQLVNGRPAGAVPGKFTVDASGNQIYFSTGNLWADETGVFRFEENQYDFNNSYSLSHVSHFFYHKGASGACAGAFPENDPRSTEDVFFTNETSASAKESFTVNIRGEEQNGWRTLSKDEWEYMLEAREVNGGTGQDKSYSLNVTFGGRNGLVIYPDDFSGATVSGTVSVLPAGVVFLPAAGFRYGTSVYGAESAGYQSSTGFVHSADYAYFLFFDISGITPASTRTRDYGFCVRLVKDCE